MGSCSSGKIIENSTQPSTLTTNPTKIPPNSSIANKFDPPSDSSPQPELIICPPEPPPPPIITFKTSDQILREITEDPYISLCWVEAIRLFLDSPGLEFKIDSQLENLIRSAFQNHSYIPPERIKQISKSALSSVTRKDVPFIIRFKITYTGWLSKEGHFFKTWQRRLFVLSSGLIQYFESDSQQRMKLKGQYQLHPTTTLHHEEGSTKFHLMNDSSTLSGGGSTNPYSHSSSSLALYMEATSISDKKYWIQALSSQIILLQLLKRLGISQSPSLSPATPPSPSSSKDLSSSTSTPSISNFNTNLSSLPSLHCLETQYKVSEALLSLQIQAGQCDFQENHFLL